MEYNQNRLFTITSTVNLRNKIPTKIKGFHLLFKTEITFDYFWICVKMVAIMKHFRVRLYEIIVNRVEEYKERQNKGLLFRKTPYTSHCEIV